MTLALARPVVSRPRLELCVGRGVGVGHHGEFLQGIFTDQHGAPCPALISVPFAEARSTAIFYPEANRALRVSPTDRHKALHAVRSVLVAQGWPKMGGKLIVQSKIQVGKGLGSSTADVVAAIRAAFAACGERKVPPHMLARLAVAAETASDGTMFEECVLFAQRKARVLARFRAPLPPMFAVGVDMAPDQRVNTLALPHLSWADADVATYDALLSVFRQGMKIGDAGRIGFASTESARLHCVQRPLAALDDLIEIARRARAAGVQIAHSGTVASILFDARAQDHRQRARQAQRVIEEAGIAKGPVFRV